MGAVPLAKNIYEKASERVFFRAVMMPAFHVVVLVTSIAYVIDSSFNPFLYFRF